jgi:hypothetical protein
MSVFVELATQCAPVGVPLALLAAVATVESGLHALALRVDGALRLLRSVGHAASEMFGASDAGGVVGVGLMGSDERLFDGVGLSGLDPCVSLRVGGGHLKRLLDESSGEVIAQSAERRAVARYFLSRAHRGWSEQRYVVAVFEEMGRLDPLALARLRIKGEASLVRLQFVGQVAAGFRADKGAVRKSVGFVQGVDVHGVKPGLLVFEQSK